MGRKKKNDSSVLVCLIDELYLEREGDVSGLTAAEVERYAQSKGLTVKAYDVRRDEVAMDRIQELKAQWKRERDASVAVAYKNLDVDKLINSSRDMKELKTKILELDGYWRKIEERNLYLEKQCSKMEDQKDDSVKREEAKAKKLEALLVENDDLSAQLRQMKNENAALRRLFKKHVYPAVAREIMIQKGALKDEETTVTIPCSAFASFIAPEKPEEFPGAQGVAPEKTKTKEEKLMDDLMKAVFEEDED